MSIADLALSAAMTALEEAVEVLLAEADDDTAVAVRVALADLRRLAAGGDLTGADLDELAEAIDDAVDLADVLPPPVGAIAEVVDRPLIRWVLDIINAFAKLGRRTPRQKRRAIRTRARELEQKAAQLEAASKHERAARCWARAERKRRRVRELRG